MLPSPHLPGRGGSNEVAIYTPTGGTALLQEICRPGIEYFSSSTAKLVTMASAAAAPRDSVSVTVVEELEEEVPIPVKQRKWRWSCPAPWELVGADDRRRLVHAAKVGTALVLVSLLYILEVLHDRLGDNSMWAVMTVVVIFELTSGGTISKGVNRGTGTVLGGGLGFMVAYAAQEIGGKGKAVVIGISVFIFGAAATYTRLLPRIKRRYDYGALIFILTFSLVSVSGIREDEIINIARDRLTAICMGFAVCIFISLFVFPMWAGDDLHKALVTKFQKLALSLEECAACLRSNIDGNVDDRTKSISSNCLSVLNSKSGDESLANFARWEPWHGRLGFFYPWNKHLGIGESLRELAVPILSLKSCLQSKHQASPLFSNVIIKEHCEAACMLLGGILKELGENIQNTKRPQTRETVFPKIESIKTALNSPMFAYELRILVNQRDISASGELSTASFVFNLMGILDRVQELAKKVEEVADAARFHQ